MELRFSEEQIMLRDVTRRLCENFCSLANLVVLGTAEPCAGCVRTTAWRLRLHSGLSGGACLGGCSRPDDLRRHQ